MKSLYFKKRSTISLIILLAFFLQIPLASCTADADIGGSLVTSEMSADEETLPDEPTDDGSSLLPDDGSDLGSGGGSADDEGSPEPGGKDSDPDDSTATDGDKSSSDSDVSGGDDSDSEDAVTDGDDPDAEGDKKIGSDPDPDDPTVIPPDDELEDSLLKSEADKGLKDEDKLEKLEAKTLDMPVVLSSFEDEVNVDVVKKVTATKDGVELKNLTNYRPTIGDTIKLKFDFKLDDRHNYGSGSTLTYDDLPEPLKALSGSGELHNTAGEKYAEYAVNDGKVVVTFTDAIRVTGEGGTLGIETIGWFEIMAEFRPSVTNTDLEQTFTLPGSEEITIYFTPVGGTTIKKDPADPENGGKSSDYVKWTVWVNTLMEDLGVAGKEFKDKLIGKHKYKDGSLTITRMQLDNKGETIPDTEEFFTTPLPVIGGKKEFTVKLPGKYAYKIEYQTSPDDTDAESEELKNEASFDGITDSKSTTINFGKPLEKSVTKVGETANWTIKVNGNYRSMSAGTKITDTWDSAEHELVPSTTVMVNGKKIGTESDEDNRFSLETNADEKGFILTLGQEITEPFTITYSTKPKDLVTSTINIKNTVVRSDGMGSTQDDTAYYSQNVLSKLNSNINYQTKKVDWTIVVNSAGYEMDNIVLDDVFVHKNLKIVEGTFLVKKGTNTLNSSGDYTLTDKGKDGFQLTIPNTSSKNEKITITYTTEYDIKGESNPEAKVYQNTATLAWETGGENYSVNDSSTVTINDQQKANGYKTGVYNYGTKKFQWSVGINYNFDPVTIPVFTDTLPESQRVLRESIKVYELDLSKGSDGNGQIKGDSLREGTDYELTSEPLANTFTITFKNPISEPYRIVYESVDADEYYAKAAANHKITNDAEFNGYSWNKDVTVQHTKNLITKDYAPVATNSAKLHWTMPLNWSQSTLNDVVITDTVGNDKPSGGYPNQMVYKDSFKIYKMKFNGTNSTPTKITPAIDDSLYEITFVGDTGYKGVENSTFRIEFNNLIDEAYQIEYDTYFLGASGTELKNTAILSYKTKTNVSDTEEASRMEASFTHSGGASAEKGRLKITKVDKDHTSTKLSGAEFELWSALSGGFLIERVKTDEEGVYEFKTMVGQTTYYLKETKAPEGYLLSESDYKNLKPVTINQPLTSIEPIKNTKIRESIQLNKTDASSTPVPLADVKFKLEKKAGATYSPVKVCLVEEGKPGIYKQDASGGEILTTNVAGIILVEDLGPGEYRMIETETLFGYWLDETPVDFTVVENQIGATAKTMKNYRQGNLKVTKVDHLDSSKILQGAVFKLTSTDSSGRTYTETTDADGIAEFKDIKYGNYTLQETSAPSGYLLSASEYRAAKPITIDDELIEITAKNKKIRESIELTKTDAGDNPLVGVKFDLYQKVGDTYNKIQENLETMAGGKLLVQDLAPGDYQLIETETLPGYWLDTEPVDFEVVKDQIEVTGKTMKNYLQGELTLKKVDHTDNSINLAGAVFELILDEKPERTYTATTGTDGMAKFEKLRYGNYTLKEITAPSGYLLDAMSMVVKDGIAVKVENATHYLGQFTNKKILNAFKLVKRDKDDSSKMLAGAEFKLQSVSGAVYEDISTGLTTNDFGEIQVGDLSAGYYRLVETKAPQYYLLDSTPTAVFEIKDKQTVFSEVYATNTRGVGSIVITKVDAASPAILLAGVTFELRNSKGTVVATKTTGADGTITFDNLPYDTYTLAEMAAHPDYVLNSDPVTIVLDSDTQIDGAVVNETVENQKKDRSVTLTKWNTNKTVRVEGAVFELRKESLTEAGTYEVVSGSGALKTDKNGEIKLTDLPVGKYQLIETTAASGYKLNSDPVDFEITVDQNATILLEKTNDRRSSGGVGGGGGYTPPDPPKAEEEDPKDPEKETDKPVKPEELVKPEEPKTPEKETEAPKGDKPENPVKEVTTEETPKTGEVEVPEKSVPAVGEEPKNGKVTIDENGKWVYTPNPGFVGKDTFTIVVTDENGNEMEIFFEIDVDEVPLGTITVPGKLPKTGAGSYFGYYLLGLSLVALGIGMRRKYS